MLRALIIAYSCEPGRGSEPGAGWGLVEAAASFAQCVVLVGPEHQDELEAYCQEHPELSAVFVAVPEPRWARRLGRHRVGRFLGYLGWLRRARSTALDLLSGIEFDLIHHATFSVFWLPASAMSLRTPGVWGPVGGAVTTPAGLWPLLGWRGVISEVIDFVGVSLGRLLPPTRRTWRSASVRIAQNEATRSRLAPDLRDTTEVWNHAFLVNVPSHPEQNRGEYLLWASALESRKGPALAIRALAHTPRDIQLVVVGDGPERARLEKLARRVGVAGRVDFRGWVAREEVADLMAGAAATVFTGLREEGGLALAEAMVVGTPVVVLANGGAATIARAGIDPERVALVEPGRVADTARRMGEAMTRLVRHPPAGRGPLLDQQSARRLLEGAYRRAAEQAGRG